MCLKLDEDMVGNYTDIALTESRGEEHDPLLG